MTRIKHDLILRIIKIMDAVLMTVPFALCWYLYYAKHIASPFYANGDYRCSLCCSSSLVAYTMPF